MRLLRPIVPVASVIACAVFLYVSLARRMSLLQMIAMGFHVTAFTVFLLGLGISWMYVLMFSKNITITSAIAIIFSGNMGTLCSVWLTS